MKNYGGNKRSDKPKDFRKRGGRDSSRDLGRPSMHHATCNNCGVDCTVPFAPTSGKPIYCSKCFDKSQNQDQKKYGNDRSDRKFKSSDSRKRSFDDRDSSMFSVVCDSCGKDCEVPFRPTKGKPIYCDKCFGNEKEKDTDQLKKELAVLNKKLDRILEILSNNVSIKNDPTELEEETEEPKPEIKPKKRMVRKKDVE